MEIILIIILIIISASFRYRFKQQKKLNHLFIYSSFMSDYYERVLINKNILDTYELTEVKKQIENPLKEHWGFSQKDIDL
jgi:hypothetical protein